jgi:hypothetical protein
MVATPPRKGNQMTIQFEKLKARLLANPRVKAGYDALAPEFEIADPEPRDFRCFASPRNDGGEEIGVLISVEPLRLTANLSNPIKLMLPVQSSPKKYFPSRFAQITSISPPSRSHLRGVSRSSRT